MLVELTGILGVYGGPEFEVNYSNGDKTSYVMTVFRGKSPLGEYYNNKGILRKIDGIGSIEDIQSRVNDVLLAIA